MEQPMTESREAVTSRPESNATYGIVDQKTLGSYNRALKRLRDHHGKEFRELLAAERSKDES